MATLKTTGSVADRVWEQCLADGVSVVRQIFPAEHLDRGWQTLKRQIAEGTQERNARFVPGLLPEPLNSLYQHESLVELARRVLGTENLALYMNRILLKDHAWSGAVAIHQDMPYFSGGLQKLSIFVPLTRTAPRSGNGGLIFLKGSHKYGNLQRGTIKREMFPEMDELAPELDAGDVVLMDFLTWHYSEDAAVPEDRPLMQITYQPSSDGSYGGPTLGVPKPTLVSGRWITEYFAAWGECTSPDA